MVDIDDVVDYGCWWGGGEERWKLCDVKLLRCYVLWTFCGSFDFDVERKLCDVYS